MADSRNFLGQFKIARGDNGCCRLVHRNFTREIRPGKNRNPIVTHARSFTQHLIHSLKRAQLKALGQREQRSFISEAGARCLESRAYRFDGDCNDEKISSLNRLVKIDGRGN